MLFRELDDIETLAFRQWARDNYRPGDPVKSDIWHPVVVAECRTMNTELTSPQARGSLGRDVLGVSRLW